MSKLGMTLLVPFIPRLVCRMTTVPLTEISIFETDILDRCWIHCKCTCLRDLYTLEWVIWSTIIVGKFWWKLQSFILVQMIISLWSLMFKTVQTNCKVVTTEYQSQIVQFIRLCPTFGYWQDVSKLFVLSCYGDQMPYLPGVFTVWVLARLVFEFVEY